MIDAALKCLGDDVAAFAPQTGLVLGSGLNRFADECAVVECGWDYTAIPGFPRATVPGHRGRLLLAHVGEARVLILQGRFHYYEGCSLEEITRPIRLLARLGVPRVVMTNAAGGIRSDLNPGDFMLISDHINFLGDNPLRGADPEDGGERFPDMSAVYDPALRRHARVQAQTLGIALAEGVYLATGGPSFETPAEIRAFRALGADAVGMSTVPEAIVARRYGLRVCALSCITNKAAGLSDHPLSHAEVARTADRVRDAFGRLMRAILEEPEDVSGDGGR